MNVNELQIIGFGDSGVNILNKIKKAEINSAFFYAFEPTAL